MRYYKPAEIARQLQISTSALRHYEAWGVVPAPERAANGYRLYTELHLAYFRCLRAMLPGFGVAVTCDVLRLLQQSKLDDALWLVNREQASLNRDKAAADKTLELLHAPEPPPLPARKRQAPMTIGDAAALTGAPASSIRHWEKEGLLTPLRDPENGYRTYTPTHLRQIMLIRTLRNTVYFLGPIKEIVHALEHQSLEHAKKLTEDAIRTIHERNRRQFAGVRQLVELCRLLQLQ